MGNRFSGTWVTMFVMPDTYITLRFAHSPDPDYAFMWWPLSGIDGKPSRMGSALNGE